MNCSQVATSLRGKGRAERDGKITEAGEEERLVFCGLSCEDGRKFARTIYG